MADLFDLLEKTSRTFALSIPLLPEPTRREVTVAYLLFRIADTFEDAASWPGERRIEALEAFCHVLEELDTESAERLAREWVRRAPVQHAGYLELLAETPFVLGRFGELRPESREIIRRHTIRTARGMAGIVSRTDGEGVLRLDSLQEVKEYCYVVAGIVGEMLTELFLLGREKLHPLAPELRERAASFGEGLQLVNILKDSATDVREGRVYLPSPVSRGEVFDLAHRDLEAATEYTLALQRAGAERGLVAFNALPVRLAWATLTKVEEEGPGSKISRPEVWAIVESMENALDEGRPALAPPSARAGRR
ncbi:MAG: squalene/phytoene synthase family protein [Gemmatimonadota bacterium]